jgi:hypothetical protein
LNLEALRNYLLPVPDCVLEQRKIADFLDHESARVDAALSYGNRLRGTAMQDLAAIRARVMEIDSLEKTLVNHSRTRSRPRLKHAVDRWLGGATPASTDPTFWTEPSDGTPWVAIGDISRRSTVASTVRAITDDGLAETRQVIAPVGTVLLAMYASVGEVAQLAISAAFNQSLLGLWIEDSDDRAFVIEWLRALRPLLGLFTRGNTQDNLSAEVIRDLPYIDLPREERVARTLRISHGRVEAERLSAQVEALSVHLRACLHAAAEGRLDEVAA